MWIVNSMGIKMAEGDYGVGLDFVIDGATLTTDDSIKFTFKDAINGTTILEKEITAPESNTITLELTAAESALLPIGQYVYSMDWYQNGEFLCNLVLAGILTVDDKT